MLTFRSRLALLFALLLVAAGCGSSGNTTDESAETTVAAPGDESTSEDSSGDDSTAESGDSDEAVGDGDVAEPNGAFVFSAELPVPGWDPHGESRNATMTYYQAAFDGLVNLDNDGGVVPALATDWEITPSEARFFLREGVTFHDGTPFDAEAVVYNIEKVQATPGLNAIALSSIDSVDVVSATEVVFVLTQPDPDLLVNLGLMPGLMLSPNVAPEDVAAGVPAGTGPYMIDTFSEDRTFLVPFADFWDPGQQGLESVEYLAFPDDSARINALATGVADAVTLRPNQVSAAEDAGFEVAETVANVITFTVYDVGGETVPELADERVRQALAHAIDRDAWSVAVNQGFGSPVFQLFEEGSPFHVADYEGLAYDPDRSRELLAEAGVTDLVLTSSGSGPFALGAQVLQQFFADIGVTLEIAEVPPGGDIAAIRAGEVVVGQSPTPDVHPEGAYGRFFGATASANPTGATLEGLEAARDAAGTAGDADESALSYQEMLRIAYEGAWVTPIHTNPSLIAFNSERYPNLVPLDRRVLAVNLRELTLVE